MTNPGNADQPRRIVIVGASFTGASAAAELREQGYDGAIILLGAETERPYERPPLSKGLLTGADPETPYVHDEGFYAEHDIDLRLGATVTALDVGANQVEVAGERLDYDRLLLATGSEPRSLPVPGGDARLAGVRTLRTLSDCHALADDIRAAGRLVVIGGGWIGCEVTASARTLGAEVVQIIPEPLPLVRVLGSTVGQVYADLHRRHGVDQRVNSGVTELIGDGHLRAVRLSDGTELETTLAVVAIGAAPRLGLATEAGLEQVEGGLRTDPTLRTSAERVYAAGDIAASWHPVYERYVRVEHWANAKDQGTHAGRTMLGATDEYDRPPYFFSDQYDHGMEYRGLSGPDDLTVLRGDPDGEFLAFWLRDGRTTAAMNANIWDQGDALDALVRDRPVVDPARLADPDVPLDQVAAS